MKTPRALWIPALVAAGLVMLDLMLDHQSSGSILRVDLPHLLYALLVALVVFFSMKYSINEHTRSRLATQQTLELLEIRVHKRTAELQSANEALNAEIEGRHVIEQALADSEERYRALFDGFPEPLTVWSRSGTLLMQNLVSARNLGGTCEDFIGETITGIFGEAGLAYQERIAHVIDTGTVETQEDAVPLQGGVHHFWTVMQRLEGWNTQGGAAQVISYDITERARLEDQARQAQLELVQVALERSAQEERQRLARDLHDSVSQALYGISLGVNTTLKVFDTHRDQARQALVYALDLTHSALADMRALIFELRPESLHLEGLIAGITQQTAALGARYGVSIELSLGSEPDVMVPVKEALYRVALEAVHNALRHAQCSHIAVALRYQPDTLQLEVTDDGLGFDPQAEYPGHLGLRSMRERMERLHGTLHIDSRLGRGTRVEAIIPVEACPPFPARPVESPSA